MAAKRKQNEQTGGVKLGAGTDLLLEKMFSWIKQRELCAEQLRKLAQELEPLRDGEGVTEITKRFLSSSTMKEVKKIEEKSSEVSDKIQELFQQLKAKVKNRSPSAGPDELDRHIMTEILRAMARQSGLEDFDAAPGSTGLDLMLHNPEVMVGFAGILTFFTFEVSGKKFKKFFAEGPKLFKNILTTGAVKGGAKAVGGAVGLAFSLPEAFDDWTDLIKENHVTEASQSLRDTAEDLLKISGTLREQFDNIKQKLQTLAEVKHGIGGKERSLKQKQTLIDFAKEHSEDEDVVQWLNNSNSDTFSEFVQMFYFLKEEIKKEKKIDCSRDLHIIFVAHGAIEASMIPASRLLPLTSITDVLLYSPWNCPIDAAVAYGVTTGCIEPQHRRFSCIGNDCQIPDNSHRPINLPNCWNSMKASSEDAGRRKIPNIFVSTLRKPEDGAWRQTVFLTHEFGPPDKNRIIVPFILPRRASVRVPFSVVTLALSLVLAFSEYKATIHLAACLGRSAGTRLNEADLNNQYACTVNHTGMTASVEMFVDRDSDLYRDLKAVFG